METSALVDGWRERLVKVQNANTAAPAGQPQFIGWCLERHDLCVAKLCAFREKDRNFVKSLLDAGLVDVDALGERLSILPDQFSDAAAQARAWLAANEPSSESPS